MGSTLRAPVLALAALVAASPALAAELPEGSDVEVHGLVSQGFLKSSANDFIGRSHRGTMDFTEGALNASDRPAPNLSVGLQLFVDRLGPRGDFRPRFDWFDIDWRAYDWLGLRAGRVKLPFGLYNEQSDYDPGRLTVLLPQSVYPLVSRDFLLAATGAEVYGFVPLHRGGGLSYDLVGGTSFLDISTTAPPGSVVDVPYTFCGRLLWEAPVLNLRLGASALATKLDFVTQLHGQPLSGDLPALLWVGSAEVRQGRLKLASEFSQWRIKFDTDEPQVQPNIELIQARGYLSGEYAVTDATGLGLYYALLLPDIHHLRDTRASYAHDAAASLRYDITPNLLFKVELHAVHGTAELDSALNGAPLTSLTEDWALLATKLTAYF